MNGLASVHCTSKVVTQSDNEHSVDLDGTRDKYYYYYTQSASISTSTMILQLSFLKRSSEPTTETINLAAIRSSQNICICESKMEECVRGSSYILVVFEAMLYLNVQ